LRVVSAGRFTARLLFLLPSQQQQSAEARISNCRIY